MTYFVLLSSLPVYDVQNSSARPALGPLVHHTTSVRLFRTLTDLAFQLL